MTLKELTDNISGFRLMLDRLEILSGPGRRLLREMPVMDSAGDISKELDAVGEAAGITSDPSMSSLLDKTGHILMCLNDIPSTLRRLKAGDILDDIELFEIKTLALQSDSLRRLASEIGLKAVDFNPTDQVIGLLDPENTRVPHFFIYDAYSEELALLRRRLKSLPPDSEEAALLFLECTKAEDDIRARLSKALRPHADLLSLNLDSAGRLDLLLAKARLATQGGLCRPTVSDSGAISYTGLFNPVVADGLAKKGLVFQPVDITVEPGATLITGANMGGKSVALKSLALAQAMTQTGMYVPASGARVAVVEDIITSMGDTQSELSGLSSFGAEMLAIDRAVRAAETGKRLLILIDEPARTTNPDEGRAIAAALLEHFDNTQALTVVTSHYSGLHASRHLRVKGLARDISDGIHTPSDISRHMDYTLESADGRDIPHDALRIATMLGFDSRIIERAAQTLENKQSQL